MAQAFSLYSLSEENLAASQASPCGIIGPQSGNGTGFSSEYSCFYLYYSTSSSYPTSSTSTCCPYQKNKEAKPGNLPESDGLSEIGENWIGKYFKLSFSWTAYDWCWCCISGADFFIHGNEYSGSIKRRNFLNIWTTVSCSKRSQLHSANS